MAINDLSTQEALNIQLGRCGSDYIADTAIHNGNYVELTAHTACVISAVTGNCTGLAGKTIPAGMSIAGVFTSITLTSGTMVAYKG
jgi:hypothetical protein